MKKIISIALALLMVAVMLPVMAMADETLQNKIDTAADGATITLDKDYTEDITIDKALTIDLNGKKLTNSAGDTITVNANGNLTITGNGTVDNVTHGKAALRIKENGKATLNGGYFNRSQEKGKGASESGENSFYTLINNGELIINNGAVVTTASEDSKLGRFSSLIENGFYSHGGSTYYPTLTINGGTFKGGLNTIKNDDNGITNIYGGKCENYYQACVQNHHKTTIYNGEFSADVSSAWSVLNCGSCSSVDPSQRKEMPLSRFPAVLSKRTLINPTLLMARNWTPMAMLFLIPSPSSCPARAATPLPPPAPITPRTPAPAPMTLWAWLRPWR